MDIVNFREGYILVYSIILWSNFSILSTLFILLCAIMDIVNFREGYILYILYILQYFYWNNFSMLSILVCNGYC